MCTNRRSALCGKDQRGAVSLEYAFLALLILLVALLGVFGIGESTRDALQNPEMIGAFE